MKPSRIVKSAWKQAGKELNGHPVPLKQYARHHVCFPVSANEMSPGDPFAVSCKWFANKAEQKRAKSSDARTHDARSMRRHNGNSGVSMRGEVSRGR